MARIDYRSSTRRRLLLIPLLFALLPYALVMTAISEEENEKTRDAFQKMEDTYQEEISRLEKNSVPWQCR